MRYRRLSDNQMVHDSEAVDGAGTLRSGYAMASNMLQPGQHIGFNMAFMDSVARSGSVSLSDAESAAIVARAEMVHRTRTAYLGDSAPAFTAEQAASAVRQASAERSRMNDSAASLATSAEAARVEAGAARAEMINRVSNAWKN